MIEVLEPQHPLLKQFIDSIYVFGKGEQGLEFTAYPGINTPVGLFRNARMTATDACIYIEHADKPVHFSMACNQFNGIINLQYLQVVDEIAVNFKPLGFRAFTRSYPPKTPLLCFEEWNALLPDLFDCVFAAANAAEQLYHIEVFLLKQYSPFTDSLLLLKALEYLNDTTTDYKVHEVAALLGVHYKQLYRSFTENVGCSPAHYRKLIRFRDSVVSKINNPDKARLVDICYEHEYTDQAYFNRQFKELTGENPTRFFRDVTAFGNAKVIFKMD